MKRKLIITLGAIGGVVKRMHNLGCSDANAGNMDKALKHYDCGEEWAQ